MQASGGDLLVRGQVLHFLDDPGEAEDARSMGWFEDGALLIHAGRVVAAGPWTQLEREFPAQRLAQARQLDYRRRLILPGLVDTHIHYPQAGVIASFGRQLLDWLGDYTFPAEQAFADPEVAQHTARFVLGRLLAHGTTTASVFATVHAHSVDAWFGAAQAAGVRTLCGKVLMDRNCPPALADTAQSGAQESAALIARWHGQGRLGYSLTPRFAATSTAEQLEACGELFASRADLHLQSHLAENPQEIAWIRKLFPRERSYTAVYERFGLLGPRAIYGHCIHLDEADRQLLAQTGTAAAFCPSSNLFLGSGFFDHAESVRQGMRVGLATDVGGGTSYSLIRTLAEAYRVSQTHQRPLGALRAWYLATLGGARALYLDQHIGNFAPGKEADFVVLDWTPTQEMDWRMMRAKSLTERLFALLILGDERCVVATHILGEARFLRA